MHGYEVSIDGQWYQIRMLMDLDEWLLALEAVGEDDHIWHWEQCQSFLQQPIRQWTQGSLYRFA